ncbi:MAG: ATP-binding protein [Pseudomonadota bacterium]
MEKHAIATSELVFLLESVPEGAVPVVLSAYSGTSRAAYIASNFPDDAEPSQALSSPFQALPSASAYSLADRETRFRTVRGGELSRLGAQFGQTAIIGITALEVSIELDDGRVLAVLLTPAAIIGYYGVTIFAIFILSIAAATLISLIFLFRPLRKLEAATQMIGHTSKPHFIEEDGSEDIRRVARALNAVQERVNDLLAERSRMVAAMAHDVRTSLTHMKLRLDDAADTDMVALSRDIETMEVLIGDMLLYARSEQTETNTELLDLGQLVQSTIDGLPFALDCRLAQAPFKIAADRLAIQRALLNLLQNAQNYGVNPHISSRFVEAGYEICIEDEGPGIPEADLPHIFDPFYRVDQSRSRATGGSGLGLSIAKSLLSAQGAMLTLANLPKGGTQALITFPRSVRVL